MAETKGGIRALAGSVEFRREWTAEGFALCFESRSREWRLVKAPSAPTSRVASEDYHSIRWNHDIRGRREAVQRDARRHDPSSVARNDRIHPIVIDVAVEHFSPRSGIRESDCVVVPGCLGQGRNYDYVVAPALKPAMKCNDAVLVVYMEWVHVIALQCGLIPP